MASQTRVPILSKHLFTKKEGLLVFNSSTAILKTAFLSKVSFFRGLKIGDFT